MNPHRKLLVLGLNEALRTGRISLDPAGDENGHLFARIAGHDSIVCWSAINAGELRLSVWWKYDHDKHPQANLQGNQRENFNGSSPLAKSQHYPRFVGAVVAGWVERSSGKFLQGHGARGLFDVYTRRGERAELDEIPTPPTNGFEPEGQFFF